MSPIRRTAEAVSRAIRRLFVLPIRIYQRFVSPLTPPRCRYYPSCSAYAVTAVQKHGIIMGTVLAVWRLLRCNPWSMGGVDHVPDKITRIYFVPKNLRKENKKEEKE